MLMTRRSFLISLTGAATFSLASSSTEGGERATPPLLAEWPLDHPAHAAVDQITGISDPIHSRAIEREWGTGPRGKALRLDGYSTWITRNAGDAPSLPASFSLELWIALATYPVSDAAFFNQHSGGGSGFFFGLNARGRWGLSLAASGAWHECFAPNPFPKDIWSHVVATFDPIQGLAVFLNGVEQKRVIPEKPLSFTPAPHIDLHIGRHNRGEFSDGDVFNQGVLNGLLSGVRIYGGSLTPKEVRQRFESVGVVGIPDLHISARRFVHDLHRPTFHAIPDAGWTNEPHGLVFWKGSYHLFYQANPNGPYWRQIHWGHLQSSDLLHWKQQPIALAPVTENDHRGCWSGSVLNIQGTPTLFYTGVDGRIASIGCAQSHDDNLMTWARLPGNPVIPAAPAGLDLMDFRDPFVWTEGKTLYMIVGTGIREKGGALLLYRATNLTNWTFIKVLHQGTLTDSGRFWEMPLLVPLQGRHLLLVTELPGRTSYWVGDWKNETFTPDQVQPRHLETINHFLSPTPLRMTDGRLIVIGIVPDLRSPINAWKAGWQHTFSLPRELSLDAEGRLHQKPLNSLRTLRSRHFHLANIPLAENTLPNLTEAAGDTLELIARIDTRGATRVGLRLRASPDRAEETLLTYDTETHQLCLDRSRASNDPLVNHGVDIVPFALDADGILEIHLFLDRSVVDVFLNGTGAFTTRIYPTRPDSTQLGLLCEGKARLESLDIWQIHGT